MEKDLSNSLFKTPEEYIEFVFAWKKFEEPYIPALTEFLLKQNPALACCDKHFIRHIHKRCELICFELFEHIWRIIVHNRHGKSPYDFPKLKFEIIKKKLKEKAPPEILTAENFVDKDFLYSMTKEEQDRMLTDWNLDSFTAWKFKEEYITSFTGVAQEILLKQIPELMELNSEWWLVYEYLFRLKTFDLKDDADKISFVIKSGLTGDWLDKDKRELKKKLDEIELYEWNEQYGNMNDA